MSGSTDYIFSNTQNINELERLQAIEQIFDPKTRELILTTGITEKWQCLEVGAGAGAMRLTPRSANAKWLATVVGDSGKVVAVDLDTRFLAKIKRSVLNNSKF
ncbi:MAG: methyltransferase [Cyanobacteriota bacterium]|nr:methyltransferase [Cyanobacteriota bacterium]